MGLSDPFAGPRLVGPGDKWADYYGTFLRWPAAAIDTELRVAAADFLKAGDTIVVGSPYGGQTSATIASITGNVLTLTAAIGTAFDVNTPIVLNVLMGSGSVASDALWDAEGDLAVGTGPNAADNLALTVPAANILNVLGVVNGETTPTWKSVHDATAPAAIGTAAAGTALTAAHRDHVHATGAGTPSTQAFGDVAAVGTGPAAAMTDHVHAMPANPVTAHEAAADPHTGYLKESVVSGFDTPAVVLGTAAAAGTATTGVRTDATLLAFDATNPSTQAFGDAAAVGVATVAARRDHKHAMPSERAASSSLPAAIGTAAIGVGATDARADHVHATGAGTPTTQAFGDVAATGTGPAAAMTDHRHGMPAAPTSVATDTLWDAAGDLAVGTGADSAGRLALTVPAADILGVLSVVNGDTTPSWRELHDATAPADIGTAAAGTALTAAHRDHVHATGAGTPAAVGTANATGTGPAAAMTDHVHAHEGGHVAHDTIWDAAGDLVQGTGVDAAAKLAISVPAANILNVVGVVNGETSWSVKSIHDATAPEAIGTAAAGTALTASHRDHVHAASGDTPSTQAFGDAAATGASAKAAQSDHKHAMMADPVPTHAAIADAHHAKAHDHTTADGSGVLTNDEHDGYLDLTEITTPSAPATHHIRAYAVDDQGKHFVEFIDEDGVVSRIQRDVAVFMVRNETGAPLTRGTAVYTNGVHAASGTPTVAKAKADSASTMPCAGLVIADIANNGFGKIMGFGRLTGNGTQPIDTSGYTVNDSLYVSTSTAGAWQNTEPAAPNIAQRIGIVTKVHATAGSIVKLEGMFERKYLSQFLYDAKGDLISASAADTPARLAVGANDTILMADSGEATGLKWVASATPSTQAFGDSASAGTADTFTRGDHKHAMPADPVTAHVGAADPHTGYLKESDVSGFAVPAVVLGTAAAAGVATTAVRTDATLLAFDATAPSTQAFGDAADVGVATVASRRDHKHAMPATPTTMATDTLWDAAGDVAVGTGANTGARLAISVPAANILNVLGVVNGETTVSWKSVHDSTAPAAIGTAAAGTALTSAHRDHVHATGAGTPSTQAFGDAASTGTGPAAAMTDHKHAMPGDGSVTLARMANLAQDQFIGRVTASTGVPETATITAAARTVLDDTTVAAMLATMGGAPLASPTFTGAATTPVINLSGEIAPTALSADVNDWNPSGLSGASLVMVSQSGAGNWKITGINAQSAGRRIVLYNAATSTLTLVNASASSSAANRFICPNYADLVIPQFGSREIVYFGAGATWVVLGAVA